MKRITIAAAFACLLAACGPAAPPTDGATEQTPEQRAASVPALDEDAPDPMANSDTAGAVWSDVADTDLIPGQWDYGDYGDGVHAGANFVFPDENEAFVQFTCNRASKQVTWWIDQELTPDQPTGVGFLVQNARYVFAGRSENSEWPAIVADVSADDPRLDVIVASESFGMQYNGFTPRMPGGPELQQVLDFCRSVE